MTSHAPPDPSQARALAQAVRKKHVAHHCWREAESDAFAALLAAQPGEVVCITGPSRAGKTHLSRRLRSLIVPQQQDLDRPSEAGEMPTVMLHAANTAANGQFSTKAFIWHALDVLQHPFYCAASYGGLSSPTRNGLDRTPERRLTEAFTEALRWRGVQYLFIDELQHVQYAPGKIGTAAAILDSMKCLAEQTQIVLVLVGAYPILDVLDQSPHMQGRKHQVHLRRYHETYDDLRRFNYILDEYTKVVPLPPGVTLRKWNGTLFCGSLGCIGLLEMWLRDCVAYATDPDQPYVTLERLRQRRRSGQELENIAAEILDGERYLAEAGQIADGRGAANGGGQKGAGRHQGSKRSRPFQSKARRYPRNGRV